jgi:hypothetical protein
MARSKNHIQNRRKTPRGFIRAPMLLVLSLSIMGVGMGVFGYSAFTRTPLSPPTQEAQLAATA